MAHKRWSMEEYEIIRKGRQDKRTFQSIADELGVTKNMVISRFHSSKVPPTKSSSTCYNAIETDRQNRPIVPVTLPRVMFLERIMLWQ